jgi:uncharacterized protein YebE (UPF0316 family)
MLAMTLTVIATFTLIVIARIIDVSLDTVRTVSIVQGRRLFAAVLGFVQAIVYVCAIGKVLQDIAHPAYIVAYGLGFALGTYIGIVVEQRLAFGHQVVSMFTRRGAELSAALGAGGYRVAHVQGRFRDGEVSILYVEIPRKRADVLIRDAGAIDDACFCVINDVRLARYATGRTPAPRQSMPAPKTVRASPHEIQPTGNHQARAAR